MSNYSCLFFALFIYLRFDFYQCAKKETSQICNSFVKKTFLQFIYPKHTYTHTNRMDVHPSRELVASGQRAGQDRKSQAHVRIWSTDSLQTLYVFGMGELIGGVTSVAFSQLVSD